MERVLYYQTYPLGIISVSKIFALITFIIGAIGALITHVVFLVAYLIAYTLLFLYNIKYRAVTCGYYRRTIHSKVGKFAQKLPPKVDLNKLDDESAAFIWISILSIALIFLPTIGGIVDIINHPDAPWLAIFLLGIYFFAIIFPSYYLKKKIIPAICTTE